MRQYMYSFARWYPCGYCADRYGKGSHPIIIIIIIFCLSQLRSSLMIDHNVSVCCIIQSCPHFLLIFPFPALHLHLHLHLHLLFLLPLRTHDEMIRNPPQVQSQRALSYWMCEIHNEVNDRMGKEIFDCNKVTERWKTGPKDGSCGLV